MSKHRLGQFLILSLYLLFATPATCHAIFTNDSLHLDVQEKYICSNGASLFCRVFGKGDPIIVVHGAPALSQDYLLPHLAKLAETNLVVFYDQRGCGYSTSELTEKQINVQTFVEDIECIRKSFNFDKVILLGHSWGGLLSMKYAVQYPEHMDKLILLGAMPASQEELSIFFKEVAKRFAPLHDKIQEIESTELYKSGDPETMEQHYKIQLQTYLYNPDNIDKLDLLLPHQGILSGSKVFELLCTNVFFAPYNIFNELATIKCPTLILHGDVDPISYQMAEHIHQAIPHSKFMKIEHCGHFPFVEQPEVMFQTIKKFL